MSPPQWKRAAAQATVEEMERFIGGSIQLRMNQLTHQLEHRPVTEGHPRTRRLGSHDRHGRELPLVLHAPRRVGGRPLPPAHAPALRLRAPLPPVGGVSRKGGTVGWRDGPYRQPGCNGAPADGDIRSFRPLFPPLVRRDGHRRARSEGGEPRHPRPDRAAGMLQDVILPEPPATRPQTLLCLKTNSQRLTKDDLFTMTENLLVNFEEIDSMQRSELNQLKAMTTTLYVNERPAYGRNKNTPAPRSLVLRDGQQPPVPHRRHRQPSLAAVRGHGDRQPLDRPY